MLTSVVQTKNLKSWYLFILFYLQAEQISFSTELSMKKLYNLGPWQVRW